MILESNIEDQMHGQLMAHLKPVNIVILCQPLWLGWKLGLALQIDKRKGGDRGELQGCHSPLKFFRFKKEL